MTVDTSGLAAAQSRVAHIQSLFGTPDVPQSSPGGDGAFDSAMSRAQVRSGSAEGARSGEATAAGAAGQNAAAQNAVVHAQSAAPAAAATSGSGTASSSGTSGSSASATTGATSSTAAAPATSGSSGSGGRVGADALLATARKYLGVPYKWGGTNPNVGLDCSGFLQLVFRQHGINLPRVAADQARQGTRVDGLSNAKPGDIIAFNSPVSHIGIYVGDGKMIHAPRTGKNVSITPVHRNITAIRRLLPEEAPAATQQVTNAQTAPATNTAALASALRNAAIAPAAAASTGATWEAAVASAVTQSLTSAGIENPEQTLQNVLTGLGQTPGATLSTLTGTTAATAAAVPALAAAASRPAGSLAPDAVGTRALDEAPAQFRQLFLDAERKYGVPATLLAAVAKQESNFKPRAVSHAGAQGLMQIMPGTARGLGISDAFDPAQAVDGAARYLRQHLRTFGSTELALAAYNAGAGNVRKYNGIPPFAETQNYVRRIMSGLRGVAA